MSRSSLLAGLVCIAALNSGCAMLKGATGGNLAKAAEEAKLLKEKGERVAANTKKDCDPLEAGKVIWSEERSVGTSIAVGYTQKLKANYFLDGMTEKDPAALKKKFDGGDKLTLSPSDKNALSAYVAVVGRNLASYSMRPDIPWTFGVIENSTANAFSAPGGYVIVTTGMLSQVENEAQLAGILAHEIGHVTGRHAINAYMGAKHTLCVIAMTAKYAIDEFGATAPAPFDKAIEAGKPFIAPILKALSTKGEFALESDAFGADFVAKITDLFMTAYNLGASKDNEYDADRTALELLLSAGYDTTQFDAILLKLPTIPFSSHPPGKDRVEALNKLRGDGGDFSMWTNGKVKGESPPACFKALPKPQS